MRELEETREYTAANGTGTIAKALLARILASATFHRSARLRELLEDIVSQTVTGRTDLLNEHSIGIRVFGRPESYNPSEDNIVRAAARQLRLKLKEFFETEGAGEEWLVEIPKGGYVAAFSRRAASITAMGLERPAAPPSAHRSWYPAAALVLAVSCLILSSLLWLGARRAPPAESGTIFASLLSRNAGPTCFVLTDSALVMQVQLRGGRPALEEYADRGFVDEFAQRPDAAGQLKFWRMLSDRQITSLADVGIMTRLFQAHPSLVRRIEIRHAQHVRTRDFKRGNFILTGSSDANPWAALFDENMNFQFVPGGIRNRKPLPGEPPSFSNDPGRKAFPARIALTANLSGDGFVLLIAGTAMEGTEAAGEFLVRGDALPQIVKALGVDAGAALPPFEICLETTALQRTARTARIVAARRL